MLAILHCKEDVFSWHYNCIADSQPTFRLHGCPVAVRLRSWKI